MPNPTPSMPALPEPFGYVSDGGPDYMQFQHGPWPTMHAFTHGTAEVYRAAQMHAYAQAVADARVREAMAGVLEALEAGHDALAAAATDYHAAMAGYRPHIHQAMDAEVASVKAVLERVRASLAAQKGTT